MTLFQCLFAAHSDASQGSIFANQRRKRADASLQPRCAISTLINTKARRNALPCSCLYDKTCNCDRIFDAQQALFSSRFPECQGYFQTFPQPQPHPQPQPQPQREADSKEQQATKAAPLLKKSLCFDENRASCKSAASVALRAPFHDALSLDESGESGFSSLREDFSLSSPDQHTNTPACNPLKTVHSERWYYQNLSRPRATSALTKSQSNNTFLLRCCGPSRPQSDSWAIPIYCLSYITSGQVHHFRIFLSREQGFYSFGGHHRTFPTLFHLLDFYRRFPLAITDTSAHLVLDKPLQYESCTNGVFSVRNAVDGQLICI